jgi:pimeloyl-ACP methyl ester carboxylesterase
MDQSHTHTLRVPGATLAYEVHGDGPVLLLIPGGPADSSVFAPIRSVLSERYKVVTYDPRGLSRSTLNGEPQDVTVHTFADDAHRVLAAIDTESAYVLGSSGGALVGFELVSRYPEQVRVLLAHEPPLARLLDVADEDVALWLEVHDTYLSDGVGPAMGKFLAAAGLEQNAPQPPADPTPEVAEAMAGMQRNPEFFLAHMWLPMADYAPDVTRLRSLPIEVAVGEASDGQLAYRAGVAFAEQLGKRPIFFPGDHGGFRSHPEAFARRLDEVFKLY